MGSLAYKRKLKRHTQGGVLVEFAITALFLVMMLFSVIEFSVEMFMRQSSERAIDVASRVYSATRSVSAAEAAVEVEVTSLLQRCVEPVDVRLFDSVRGIDMSSPTAGRAALGDASDSSAVFARISLRCDWERMTPIVRSFFGSTMTHEAVSLVRMRQ